jgi:hypothetical protein
MPNLVIVVPASSKGRAVRAYEHCCINSKEEWDNFVWRELERTRKERTRKERTRKERTRKEVAAIAPKKSRSRHHHPQRVVQLSDRISTLSSLVFIYS